MIWEDMLANLAKKTSVSRAEHWDCRVRPKKDGRVGLLHEERPHGRGVRERRALPVRLGVVPVRRNPRRAPDDPNLFPRLAGV